MKSNEVLLYISGKPTYQELVRLVGIEAPKVNQNLIQGLRGQRGFLKCSGSVSGAKSE
jgi:hypothetical protein